jgi:hypothetical protein
MIFEFKENEVIGFIAQSQTGKTYAVCEMLRKANVKPTDIYVLNSNLENDYYKVSAHVEKPSSSQFNIKYLNDYIRRIRTKSHIILVIDDIDLYLKRSDIDTEFKNLLTNGKHQRITLIYTIKSPSYILELTFNETQHLFIGNFITSSFLKKINGILPKEYKDITTELKEHEFVYFNKFLRLVKKVIF